MPGPNIHPFNDSDASFVQTAANRGRHVARLDVTGVYARAFKAHVVPCFGVRDVEGAGLRIHRYVVQNRPHPGDTGDGFQGVRVQGKHIEIRQGKPHPVGPIAPEFVDPLRAVVLHDEARLRGACAFMIRIGRR